MGPLPHSDRFYSLGQFHEVVPRLAYGFHDGVVVLENSVREPIGPHVLPDVLHRIKFWRPRRQQHWFDVWGHEEFARGAPCRAIHDENGVRAARDLPGNFIDMRLYGFSIDPRRCDSRAGYMRRADRSKQIVFS